MYDITLDKKAATAPPPPHTHTLQYQSNNNNNNRCYHDIVKCSSHELLHFERAFFLELSLVVFLFIEYDLGSLLNMQRLDPARHRPVAFLRTEMRLSGVSSD